ncbi:DUF2955 domain-containing protein [Colwellia psychrerythraea]|uniref:DUF2955 domain-containing protein n=1 Tax=Colwellia psychrerythraea TaxID=28229 RepID=A0A099KFD0_COLPS|nr:DUF2955 domain-containing protein [Colwellia psychrerythraea]KGJ89051.1 Protein of unknown function DUF2955 [Colwellia psychrerythraea]
MSIKMTDKSASIGKNIFADVKAMRTLRFAFGVTFACALAYGINWPLAFLMPVFTAMILAMPLPKPSVKASFYNMVSTLQAFAIGLAFSLFFLQYPMAYLITLALVLFHLYYYLNRGGSFWFTLMAMIAILILPMIANTNEGLAIGFSAGFVYSSWLTIVMLWLAHFVFPDPSFTHFPVKPKYSNVYSKVAAKTALKSTLVVFPIAAVFISYGLSDYLLVIIFSALFILKPDLAEGKEAGMNSLLSTLLGGTFACVFYWLIVAVPQFNFYLFLLFATALFFGRHIFSGTPIAKYYSSGFIALLVIVNSAMAADSNFSEILVQRVLLICSAIFYIICALKVLERFWFKANNQ